MPDGCHVPYMALFRRSKPRPRPSVPAAPRAPPKPFDEASLAAAGVRIRRAPQAPRAALYARVSTRATAAGDERQDPEVQLSKLRQFAAARGYRIVAEYQDRASGADPRREQLEAMMQAAFRREFDTILIVRLDRITRSLANLLSMLEELEAAKVNLIATDQNIELSSPTGKLMVHLLGAFAEWEREIIQERVRDGLALAKKRGTRSGRPIGRPPSFSPKQWERAKAILQAEPEISYSELSRRTGMERRTLQRKVVRELGGRPEIPGPEASKQA
jgi:DNA invertase Pin-like site-specific DNA recombinase